MHENFLRWRLPLVTPPVMRPSRMVTIRSLIASTSGSSDEIAMTAMPLVAIGQELVNLGLGAHIDAARRLVDDQYLGPQRSQRASTIFC